MSIEPVRSEAELREIVAEPAKAIANKAASRIDAESRRFIEASPFCLLATTGEDGTVDVSPRGDPPGSVLVFEDGRSIALPDRKGNRRLDSMCNILGNDRVGMLFLVPGVGETLRLNGRARLVREAPFFERMAVQGKPPALAILIEVEELFLHCGKAFLRSSLWDPETWPTKESLPSAARIAKSQTNSRVPEAVFKAALNLDYKHNQY
ncbi:pyridoxamine 5'-phosphate oxidase family protein [Sciscionella marina]|uniref:pyridoxamine 5'-phosphate oxidase family protein n=1 Tax=Sciscionella marina TaxID=508770 RepID=UPI000381FB8A|nr:pyridoxamine 5'-phosphate oxidase family protein [Sciscionella marina]